MARPEQERDWLGVLERRDRPVGPDSRPALTYALVTDDRELDVYAAHAEGVLAPLQGLRVVGRGKLVDLGDEGFGAELWLASIDRAEGDDVGRPAQA